MKLLSRVARKFRRKDTRPMYQQGLKQIARTNMTVYKSKFGYRFNIQEPVLFTEKLQWYKLYYRDPRIARIVDKYDFKKYIREKLGDGHTIPLIGVYNSTEEVEKAWDAFPEKFCLKSTISSNGENIFPIVNKAEPGFHALEPEIRKCFDPKTTMLNSFCTGYYDCVPRVIVEEYAENVAGQLYDYKVFCFSGKPFCIYAASDHFTEEDHQNGYPISFYDLEWNRLEVQYGNHRNEDIPRPKHLAQMIEEAACLAEDYPFIRVDFFDTEDTLYLAEMTFYPGGGLTPYHPESFNRQMGELFILPKRTI